MPAPSPQSAGAAPVLLMVSGGADSTALLRLAHAGHLGPGAFAVLHVDHAIREESADDARWVEALCTSLDIPVTVAHVDVPALLASEGGNLEDVARRVRYAAAEEALDRHAESLGADPGSGFILTAHTRDDRVETFLMRAIVGAGLSALSSIPRSRGRIRRPLLDVDRAELEAYLAAIGQPFLTDRTNIDTTRLRAHVRHRIVVPSAEYNPSFNTTLARTLDLLGEDADYLEAAAQAAASEIVLRTAPGEELALSIPALDSTPLPLSRRVVRSALIETFPELIRIESEHIDRIARAARGVRLMADIGGDLRVERQCDTLVFFPSVVADPPADTAGPAFGGSVLWGTGKLTADIVEEVGESDLAATVFVDADAVGHAMSVGSPRTGERMRPLGMEGSKLLSDVLIDARVPRRNRAHTPVVRAGDEVVWVVGGRLDDRYRIDGSTERIGRLSWREGNEQR